MTPPKRQPEFDAEHVRDISEAVDRDRKPETDLADIIAEKGAAKIREYAGSYDSLTRSYLRATKVSP